MPILTAAALLLPGFARAGEEPDGDGLRFAADGSFTIMLLSDAQDTQYPPAFLTRSIEAVLSSYEVDLVVLLGNQLEGGSPVLRIGNNAKNVEKALTRLLDPLKEAGRPFAFVYGSQDYLAPLGMDNQTAIYRRYDNCVTPAFDESGAYYLDVYPYQGDAAALRLYFFASGPDFGDSGQGAASQEQVAWYTQTSSALRAQSGMETVPAVAFVHAPVAEVYGLFTEVPADTPSALARGGKSYLPNKKRIFIGAANEAPSPAAYNYGLYGALVAQGDVFLLMSGSDHNNSFIGALGGIDLGAAPGSSYTSYGGAEERGVRLLRFYEDDVRSYDTIHVRYADFLQTRGLSALRYYLSTTSRIPNYVKTLASFLLLLAAIALIARLAIRAARRPRPAEEGGDPGFDDAL